MECCNKKQDSVLSSIKKLLGKKEGTSAESILQSKKVVLVGNPNVGKSVIFNSLTGAYVTVSNYPGTTVEVSRGWFSLNDAKYEVIDTPGMYSLIPITEEERVTRKLLIDEKPDLIVHVIDAKNIARMLPLTLQLIEAGFWVVLVLNIMDEAKAVGLSIDCEELENILKIPVLKASAALNMGLGEIKKCIGKNIENQNVA